MDLAGIKVLPVTCCCCCCFWTLFTAIAVPLSFKSLEQGKYALSLSWSTQQIGPEVVQEPGMKAVGLGNSLVEFPATFQTMYFVKADGPAWGPEDFVKAPIRARSQDGLEMHVSVSFQYKLDPSNLHDLYTLLGHHLYRDEFVRFARGAIVEACAGYGASSFFTNRSFITASMVESLDKAFWHPENGLRVAIKGLQLREVELPPDFDAEITRTQEEMQEVQVAMAERQEEETAYQTKVIEAEQEVLADLKEAEGEAEAITIENRAEVDMMIALNEEVAQSNFLLLMQFANDTNSTKRLFDLMEVHSLTEHDAKNLLINV